MKCALSRYLIRRSLLAEMSSPYQVKYVRDHPQRHIVRIRLPSRTDSARVALGPPPLHSFSQLPNRYTYLSRCCLKRRDGVEDRCLGRRRGAVPIGNAAHARDARMPSTWGVWIVQVQVLTCMDVLVLYVLRSYPSIGEDSTKCNAPSQDPVLAQALWRRDGQTGCSVCHSAHCNHTTMAGESIIVFLHLAGARRVQIW